MASFANVEKRRGRSVFFGIQQVGTFLTEAITDFASLALTFAGRGGLRVRHGRGGCIVEDEGVNSWWMKGALMIGVRGTGYPGVWWSVIEVGRCDCCGSGRVFDI